ncbi:MAG: hypothetical protein HKN19_10230 [Halioglobus sp.]|nr:hypothetical protein [Halioglobus sp.]
MKSDKRLVVSGFVLAVLLLSGGCASPGLSDAALSGDPQAMWDEGKKMAAKGEKLIADAESELAEGRDLVRQGEARIDQGTLDTLQARQDYQAAARAAGDAKSPGEVDKEIKRFKKIGDKWEDAIDEVRDGNNLVKKGNKRLAAAREDIRKGRALIEAGSTLMRNSQRLQWGEELLPRTAEAEAHFTEQD